MEGVGKWILFCMRQSLEELAVEGWAALLVTSSLEKFKEELNLNLPGLCAGDAWGAWV